MAWAAWQRRCVFVWRTGSSQNQLFNSKQTLIMGMKANRLMTGFVLMPLVAFAQKTNLCLR